MFILLVFQVTTVAQYRSDRHQPIVERTFRIIGRIGQSLNLAIERFVTVCETIADESPHFKKDMFDLCKSARTDGMYGFYINVLLGMSNISTVNFFIFFFGRFLLILGWALNSNSWIIRKSVRYHV